MLFSISIRSVRLISVYCLNLVTIVLSCNTVYTYTAVCKCLFVCIIFLVFLFVLYSQSFCLYFSHFGLCTWWRTNTFPTTELCLSVAFCAIPKRLSTRIPFERLCVCVCVCVSICVCLECVHTDSLKQE